MKRGGGNLGRREVTRKYGDRGKGVGRGRVKKEEDEKEVRRKGKGEV